MLVAQRHARIAEMLRSAEMVSTEALAHELGVSSETIRRDLVALERDGALRRVHGGAASTAAFLGEELAFDARQDAAAAQKSAIGHRAAELITPAATVILDVGTTALAVARALPAGFRGTVATCSLLVAAEVGRRREVEVLVCGGRVRAGDLALSNAQAVDFFADLHADIAFLGSGGVDVRAGLTDFHHDEVATRRVIVANTARSFVLADSSKLGRVAPHRVCDLAQLAGLITDSAPRALRTALRRVGASVLLA